ncbi:unnamed protein product [Ostreobium quekettii]|uniref:DUF4461 domain-containing protein n=1 Tax=Ostreobium quekettii TaxID=121088 RepID=A0A8S1IQ51_9CHLO|nr:unnamed protein product [Ostreobium quekettii]
MPCTSACILTYSINIPWRSHAQGENERSLKLLQEYLREAKSGSLGNVSPPPYRFVFFVKDKEQEKAKSSELRGIDPNAEDRQSDTDAMEKLHRVAITLPPPARNPAGLGLPRGARKALVALMESCGLPQTLTSTILESKSGDLLREFLPEAAEMTRKQAQSSDAIALSLANAKLALRMGRQVAVGFGASCATLDDKQQLELLEGVAWALDRSSQSDVRGCQLMLGEERGVDAVGRVWLHSQDTPSAWLQQLLGTDIECVHLRRSLQASRHVLESQVAAAMGVSMVYASSELMVTPMYMTFLKELHRVAQGKGRFKDAQLSRVPVCVVRDDSNCAATVNEKLGFISLSVSKSPDEVYRSIEELGPAALTALEKKELENKRIEKLQREVRQRLKLRRFMRDPALDVNKFRTCCRKLLQDVPGLIALTEGLSLRVSNKNRVAREDGTIEIAWDSKI